MTRKYRLQKRALLAKETRQRIIDAAVHLHTTIGPAQTSISAIATQAGVERLTVYRHFPTERELLTACSGDYLEKHPSPDPATWRTIVDPFERLRTAIDEVYRYYEENQRRWVLVQRDAQLKPELQEFAGPYRKRWSEMRNAIAEGLIGRRVDTSVLNAWLSHILDFRTWTSLVRDQALSLNQVTELYLKTARCLAVTKR